MTSFFAALIPKLKHISLTFVNPETFLDASLMPEEQLVPEILASKTFKRIVQCKS
jgi:hypothetical protein